MSLKTFRTVVELDIHAVTNIREKWIPHRRDYLQDVYLSVDLFGQNQRTLLTGPLFPIRFHQKFKFDKFFYSALNAVEVVSALEDYSIVIQLIQLSDIYVTGRCLASYECNAKDFFYPYPCYSGTYSIDGREEFMDGTIDCPVITPKLEFSTKTTVREVYGSVSDSFSSDEDLLIRGRASSRRSRSRQRSVSPSVRRRLAECSLTDSVVAKRQRSASPSILRTTRSRSLSPTRSVRVTKGARQYGAALDDTFLYTPRRSIYRVDDPLPVYSDTYRNTVTASALLDYDYDYNLRKYLPSYSKYVYPASYRSYNPYSAYYDPHYTYGREYSSALDDLTRALRRSRSLRYPYY